MPADRKHKQYQQRISEWELCRAVLDGEESVKAKGELFLPRLSGQSPTEYEAYKKRASFFAASNRTVNAMLGMIFREDTKVVFPDSRRFELESITLDRRPFDVFAKEVAHEVLGLGRFGILVDADEDGERVYLVGYQAESIINWRSSIVGGEERLELVVLLEEVPKPDTTDIFGSEMMSQIRVLYLDDSGGYAVDLYHKKRTDASSQAAGQGVSREEWQLQQTIVPVVRGQRFGQIPFIFVSPTDLQTKPERPPILDLAAINISHYRSSADLEHGRHFTALPTPWAAGFSAKQELRIGSSVAWVTEEPQASCGFLEFTGQGLSALEKALADKERQMAVLGSRLLEPDKAGVEAAETLRMRRSSESSVLSSVASTVSHALTMALNWYGWWAGVLSDEINVELNDEFYDDAPSAEILAQLMTGVQLGLISFSTFYYNVSKANLYPEGWSEEQERAHLLQGLPAILLPPEGSDGSETVVNEE